MAKSASLIGFALALLPFATCNPLRPRATNPTCTSKPALNLTACSAEIHLGEGYECGFLKAPIDHEHPETGTFDLFVSRRKASGTSGSIGTLLFNLGGPGGAAYNVFQATALGIPTFSERLLHSYDIIAIDPRGTGYSNPISCDRDIWNNYPSAFATADESFATLVKFNRDLSASCDELTGPLFQFLDTVSTVKDYELVRQALGVDNISFIGFSYGTLQGQVYAELFPEHVDRFVLDGLVDHTVGGSPVVMAESQTYEATLNEFFSWCNATAGCPLTGTDVASAFKELASSTSLPAPSCNGSCHTTISGEDVIFNAQLGLTIVESQIRGNWSQFAAGIQAALAGDAAAFSPAVLAENVGSGSDSRLTNRATMCQDWGSSAKSPADLKRVLDVATHFAPITKGAGQGFQTLAYCIGWTAPVKFAPRRLDADQVAKLPPMMLVNAFYDPETSAAWINGVRDQLPNSVNLYREGAGHVSYWLYGSTQEAMDEFLITGALPADGQIYDS